MDTLPLPPRPNLEQYKKRAKDLVTAANSTDPTAVKAWGTDWIATLARLLGVTITPFVQGSFDHAVEHVERRVREKFERSRATDAKLTLADAQHLLAEAHGFENWAEFANHVRGGPRKEGQEFEAAVDAVVSGDLSTLESLIRQHPDLIRARSARVHRATLLHYVAANGVEDFRQKTPPNAVAIARCLLQAGAEVDALANTYGGGKAQTTMNLLVSSTHPAEAGLQSAIAETLLEFGAAINGLEDDGSPLITALAFGYRDTAETLARRGARVDNVASAAALGRLDLVRNLVADTSDPKPSLVSLYWVPLSNDAKANTERALLWACMFGRTAVVEFLLEHGVDPAAKDVDKLTALHWASAYGHLDIMKLLLERGAPLEVENAWGGTVLDSTVYFACRQPIKGANYPAVIETLIAAGADMRAVTPYPTGNDRIDELLSRRGARPG